ncbi:thiol reductant ABC exporter subunit CydC [Trueperella pecoris]|uniref:Thiol reductant ABC exporter subunit CydC n=1 Tax=Trueperella pecoris TaxID=2733571 RepID=A0A7M1QSQ1_9ACTO|nr:thiol reductant ABC exporter subunit CydC [Trueperella pecoris]QOR44898.1 thiol reductant ABC exporter subunit CydC [Trueperella pecoris]QTG74807.1 thiol reductant ABC exporter subunit CydC [Trueperella pecoris]
MNVIPKDERVALKRAISMLDYNKKTFAWSVAAGSGAVGSGVCLGATSAWLIARAAELPPVLDLSVASTAVRMFGVGKAIFRYLERIASHWVGLYGMANLRSRVYSSMANSTTDVVTSVKRGDLLARTGADVDEVGNVVVMSMLPAAVAVIVSLLSLTIVGLLSPLIALVLLVCLLISGLVAPFVAAHGASLDQVAQIRNRAELNAHSLTILESASELLVSGRMEDMEAQRAQTEHRIQRSRDRSARPAALASALDTLAMGLAVVGALLIGTQQMATGNLSGIELVVCTLLPLSAFEATSRLGAAATQLVRSAAAAKRIVDLLDAADSRQPPELDRREPTDEGLVARGLVIGWPDGPTVAGPIDLDLRRGKTLAIVGPSGIGKSTLLYTLAGMLEPKGGQVSLNGRDAWRIERQEISADLSLTAEDAHVFETTVLENLRVARASVTPEEAADLLRQAGLADWLAQLPDGVETMLGSDATSISGGERRRLLLARALAGASTYMLLDEPGEHLDPRTADELIRDLLSVGGAERGVILVTHRLTPLDAVDEVIMLGTDETGQVGVVARGTHAELAQRMPSYEWSLAQE